MNKLTKLFFCFLIIGFYSCKPKTILPDALEAGWKGKKVCEVLKDNAELRVLKCTFPPSVGHEEHYHRKHFGYTLVGSKFKIKDVKGVKEVDVPTGYSFSNDERTSHQVINIGNEMAVFLIIEPK